MNRRLLRPLGAALLALLVLPGIVLAHPLGNFTINHYDGIRVGVDVVAIDHVLDMAEIPTFSERADMDTNGDGTISDPEAVAYEAASCARERDALDLQAGGDRLALQVAESGLSFPMGQGAATLRLVCVFRGSIPSRLTARPTAFTFANASFPERRGWHEVVVQGDGSTLSGSDAPTIGVSRRLTAYPADLLSTPSDQRSAGWSAVAGGPALPALDVPDAKPVGVTAAGPGDLAVAGTPAAPAASPAAVLPAPVSPVAPGATAPSAAVPGGIGELGGEVGALFQTRDLTLPVIALSLLVAAALGALHALSPGHGKTVMAAYLVGSQGSARHALGLGMTVTVSHTIGVLALGLVSLSFAAVLPPERLYPVLGLVSGVIVVVIGAWLILGRVRVIRGDRIEAANHALAHAQRVEHGHRHPHEDGHSDKDGHSHPDAYDDLDLDGWHTHTGLRHTHLPPRGAPLSWRGLFALGLAGGMVPSVSALILLLGSVSLGRPAYGIALTIAFGIGMAAVLVGVGLALVYARGLLDRFPRGAGGQRVTRILPTATAFVVLFAGLLITTQALLTLR